VGDNGGMKGHRGAVMYCVRADARRSWPTWLALGLLVGIAAGAVMAAAAGARRTESAYQDLRAETAAMDGALVFPCGPEVPDCPPTAEDFSALPGVAEAAYFTSNIVPILDSDGRVVQVDEDDPCASGNGAIDVTTPLDPAFGTTVQGIRIVEGRAADPTRADEVVMSPLAADALDVSVGDRLFPYLVPCDADRETWGAPTPVTVVGLGLTTVEVPPKNGFYVQTLHTTPAFADLPEFAELQEVSSDQPRGLLGVRLDEGITVDEVRAAPGAPRFEVALDLATEFTQPVDEGLQSDANALWLVALLGGGAALFVLGPTLVRYRGDAAAADMNLAALGWSRRDRVLRSALHGLFVGSVAVLVAIVVVLAVSTRTPIGDARAIEPSPGIELDLVVAAMGGVATLGLVSVGLAALAFRAPTRDRSPRRTPLARLGAGAGLSPSAVLGIRIGLEPGRGQAPVRSSVFAVALGLTAISGVLVYTSSVQHLRETPAWVGLAWDDFVYVNDNPAGLAIADTARSWPEAESAGHALFFTPSLSIGETHEQSQVLAFSTGPDAVEPTVITGRPPAGVDDVLLSPHLANTLGATVGDRIDARLDLTEITGGALEETEPFTLEVVGIGPVPLADGNFDIGSAVTYDGLIGHLPAEVRAQFEADPRTDFVLIDRAEGVTDRDIRQRFAEAGVEIEADAPDIEDYAATVVGLDPTSTESAPNLLAGLMALMAGGVLAYGLVVAVNRNGHDLAVARALGLTPRLVRRTSRWAGVAFTSAALVLGVPLGIVLGRVVWRTYAEGLGVVPDPVTTTWEIAAVALAALGLALLVGTLAARWETRDGPAAELRSE